jgi:hypothetical protein
MKIRSYIKKAKKVGIKLDFKRFAGAVIEKLMPHKVLISRALGIGALVLIAAIITVNRNFDEIGMSDLDAMNLTGTSIAASTAQKSVITIPSGMVKANPFVPYRDITETGVVNDIPPYNLVEPPEAVNENSDAARVMDTIVSGILFDKFSPSAIINIEGTDYLVKKGDVVNNYKVLAISQDSVTVQLGSNSYSAGIGEILTEGSVNHNDVSNLNNKFGGGK